jgi:hypothetical protein
VDGQFDNCTLFSKLCGRVQPDVDELTLLMVLLKADKFTLYQSGLPTPPIRPRGRHGRCHDDGCMRPFLSEIELAF